MKLRSISSTCSSGRRPLAPARRPQLAVQDRRPPQTPTRSTAGHCFRCGTPLQLADRAEDTLTRLVCPSCQFVHYENPKVLVGGIVTSADRILLCQRALQPGQGLWAPPAGFLEHCESLEAGAVREIREETGVVIDPRRLVPYILSSLIDLQQVYVFFSSGYRGLRALPGAGITGRCLLQKKRGAVGEIGIPRHAGVCRVRIRRERVPQVQRPPRSPEGHDIDATYLPVVTG